MSSVTVKTVYTSTCPSINVHCLKIKGQYYRLNKWEMCTGGKWITFFYDYSPAQAFTFIEHPPPPGLDHTELIPWTNGEQQFKNETQQEYTAYLYMYIIISNEMKCSHHRLVIKIGCYYSASFFNEDLGSVTSLIKVYVNRLWPRLIIVRVAGGVINSHLFLF